MKPITFNYIVYAVAALLASILLLSGCSSPAQALNILTPDRLGYGIMDGSMNIKGTGNMNTIFNSHVGDVTMDMEGSSETSIVYLEWDIPTWSDDTFGYHGPTYENYVRERRQFREYMMRKAEAANNTVLDEWYDE